MPHALTIPISLGSEPEIIEIDDCSEVVGVIDSEFDDFNEFDEVIELCIESPTGQCLYSALDGHRCCIYCGKGSGAV